MDDAAAELTKRLGPRFQTALIGPAGENLVRFATIVAPFDGTAVATPTGPAGHAQVRTSLLTVENLLRGAQPATPRAVVLGQCRRVHTKATKTRKL